MKSMTEIWGRMLLEFIHVSNLQDIFLSQEYLFSFIRIKLF